MEKGVFAFLVVDLRDHEFEKEIPEESITRDKVKSFNSLIPVLYKIVLSVSIPLSHFGFGLGVTRV